MIVEYSQHDDSTLIFGYMMSDGPLTQATGRMLRGWHHKCYHVSRKRAAKGDQVTGRVVAGAPSAYEVDTLDERLPHMQHRLAKMRALAELMGKGVGDAQVQEAFEAEERGGPYPHTHSHRLETYQLMAHLEYAHGIRDANLLRSSQGLAGLHGDAHASEALARVQGERQHDAEPVTRDWREQFTAEID